jgi:GTPase
MTDIAYKETTTAVAVAGSADSGKSSFIGVIISGKLDNGNGSARELVAKHQHEIKRGKTSDISTRVLDIPDKNQALTIIDLCGQADYFKTTTFGLSGYFPDYSFLIVSGNKGVLPMTIQHMRILVSLSIPIIVVITHVDIAPPLVYQQTIEQVKKLILNMCGKTSKVKFMNNPFDEKEIAKTEDELIAFKKEFKKEIKEQTITMISEDANRQISYPVITISNKTGYYIDVMKEIMKDLPIRDLWVTVDEKYITSNKIIKFFKQNMIQRVYENFVKVFVKNILDYAELHTIITQTAQKFLEIQSKNKEEQKSYKDPNSQSFISKIISSITPDWLTGKMTNEQIIENICKKDICYKYNYDITSEQIKFITDFIKNLENLEDLNKLDENVKNNMKFYIRKNLMKYEISCNIISNSFSCIIQKLFEKNIIDDIIIKFYDIFSNLEFSSNIKKMESNNLHEEQNIKNIIEKSNIHDILKQKEIDTVLFQKYQKTEGSVFYIDNCYNPPGIGLVITGINRGDDIKTTDKLFLGPVGKDFTEFKVKSMHNNNRQIIDKLSNHSRGTIAIALAKKGDIRRNQIRKGMIAMSNLNNSRYICYRFKAAITIFAKSVTVRTGYTPVIHIGTIRQPARIILDPEENDGQDNIGFNAKSTNIAIVTFKFKINPEFIEPYSVFLFRSGDIHGLGVILSCLSISQDPEAKPDEHKVKIRH